MSALSHLLDRLRSVSPPPGAAATVVAVPSAGEELSSEVEFLFGELDQLHGRHQALLEAARAEAAALHDAAIAERARLLAQARADAEQLAAQLLDERRERCKQLAAAILADGAREAELVAARGRRRTPALVEQVLARVLETRP